MSSLIASITYVDTILKKWFAGIPRGVKKILLVSNLDLSRWKIETSVGVKMKFADRFCQNIRRMYTMILVVALSGNLIAQSETDWPGFLGAKRDSRSIETGILKDWSNGKLKTLWTKEVGAGYVLGAVSGGSFFSFDAKDQICRLTCLDAKTGEQKWQFKYAFQYKDMYQFDEGPRATPIIDNGKVFIYGVEGMLHCLDAEDGSVVWKKNLSKDFGVVQNFFGVGSTPIIHENFLIVMVGGSPASDQGKKRLDTVTSDKTAIVVLEKSTGNLLNKFGEGLASYSSVQLYRDTGNTFGVAWLRDNAIGFDFEKGEQLWSFPYRARRYESVNAATPVVDGTRILLTESYEPGCIQLDVKGKNPKVAWRDHNRRQHSLACHWNTPVFHNGYVYGCHGSSSGNAEIRCVDWNSGQVKWKKTGYARSSLTYVDGHLVVLDENGRLLLVDATPSGFKLVSQYSDKNGNGLGLKSPCWAAPVIANGILYVRGNRKIVCLRLIEK